ncbi:MAG: transposase [Anaerolineae bacterium]|nr:transposase [Anaerolineae bacterium]
MGEGLVRLYDGKGMVGGPAYGSALMFSMLLLSCLYDLSARDTERLVNENIPARHCLGLALAHVGVLRVPRPGGRRVLSGEAGAGLDSTGKASADQRELREACRVLSRLHTVWR